MLLVLGRRCCLWGNGALFVKVLTHGRRWASSTTPTQEPPAGAAAHRGLPPQGTNCTTADNVVNPVSEGAPVDATACLDSAGAPSSSCQGDEPDTKSPIGSDGAIDCLETEPIRWEQPHVSDMDNMPIIDEKGEYIVSRVQWPTGEIAYTTPPPPNDKLEPRFGYNVVQVKKHVSWWKYNQSHPRLSLAYINIQVIFLIGAAWLVAFLTTEYRRTTDAMKTPGAMVGEHRGRGPATAGTQKVRFSSDEMGALVEKAQNNWYDGKAEANYIGSKEYQMKKIPRPKEFSIEDLRKR